ncbi:receptor L domain-containing protein, partial [Maribacter spongiicola]|uniref:hypothetical protein n=1 Tax=Maribacter spongiicola TaxID=1206753 RepID=UPI0014150CD6
MKKKLSILFFLVTILYGYAQDEVSFVSDINPGIANSNPREFLVAEDFLWFIADNENGFVGAHRMDQQENILEFTSGVDAYGLESFQGAEYVILGDPFGRDFGSLYGLNSSPAGGLLSNTTIWGKELFAYGNQLYFSGEIDNPDVNNFRSANLISYDGTNAQQIPNPVGFPVGLNLEPRDFTLGSDGKIYFIGNDTNSTLAIYSFDGIQINSEVDNILISDYYVSSLTSFSNYVCYYDFAFVDYDLKSFNILNKENNTIGSFAYNPEAGLYDFNDYMYSGGSGGLASWNSDFTSNNLYGATYDLKKILGSFNNQLLQSSTFDNISFFPSKFFECGDFNTIREPVNNSTSDFNPLTGIEFNNKFYFSANDENSAIGQELYSYRTNYYCGDIFLSTQQEVEEFGAYNYIEIDGQVSIGGDDIVDLTSLTSWQTISGGLIIGNNINLSNLSGLNNLNEIGSFNNDYDISLILADNQNLNDLSAFQNLTQIDGLIIENNPVLASLEGLHNLVSTRDFFVIQNNDALTDFSGLRGLNGNGFINVFVIESNDNLTSLNGLQNFSPVVQTLSISNNLKIRSLAPLSGFTNEIGNGVSDLINNSKLTSFCGAFGLSSEPMTITGNAQNPTQAEIVSAGPCIYTSIPDDNFEAYLIAQNIDNEQIADNRILTSDATDALLLDLSGFDVSNFEGLQAFSNITSFSLINNQAAIVQEVNFSGNLLLETLTIINAPNVPSIDISQNNLINDLAIVTRGNLFSEIDLAGKNSITTLELADNQISTIDLNGTPNLTYLSLAINPLTQIDVTSLSALESISTYESQITTLDVSQNSNLTSINSDNGALTSVNIKNGFNNLLEFVEFNGNPGLNCILVDDVAFAEGQTISVTNPTGTWNKDNSSSYNEVSCNPITVEFLDDDIIGVESEQTDQQFVGLLVNGTITSNTTVTVSFISGDAIASPNTNADFSLGTNGQVTIDIPLGNYDGFSNPIFLSGFIDDNDPFEIIDDAIYEGNENLVLGITDFTGDITAVGTSSQLQYEIIDDDYVPRIRVVDGIASESATIDTAEFIFELTDGQGNLVPNDFYQDLFIEYAITGSAVETDDYQNLEQVLLTGVNAQSIFIFPEDDELTELTEDVILTVTRTGVLPFYQLGTTASTATVQILDNEIPGFTLSTIIVTTSEPNNSDSFTVVLNAQPVSDVVIDIASNNTAEAVTTPTSLTFTNANWDIPQTVTVN